MLAGLLFATHDAEDGPSLTATLPFGATTLLEYQARLLLAAGASQIVVVVGRLTPELLGAVARIGRRGCTVDAVRSAAEAIAKLHPLARVVMLADGLVAQAETVAQLAAGEGDALLVLDPGSASGGLERVGDGLVWAGIARVTPARLAEVAAMPRDYDIASALLRTVAQAGAKRIALDPQSAEGHGVHRRASALEALGRMAVEHRLRARAGWFDRYIAGLVMRPVLRLMMARRVATLPLALGAAAGALGGLLALWSGQMGLGLVAVVLAVIAGSGARAFAEVRDEMTLLGVLDAAILGLPLLAFLLLGRAADLAAAGEAGLVGALALAGFAALGEQATRGIDRRGWYGGTGGLLLLVTLGTLAGIPAPALLVAAGYAAAALAAAIEDLRAGLAAS